MTSIIIFKNSKVYEEYIKLSIEYYENERSMKKYIDLKYSINFYCPYYEKKHNYGLSSKLHDLINESYPVTVMKWSGSQKNGWYGPDYSYKYSMFHLENFTHYGKIDNRLSRITERQECLSEIDKNTINIILKICNENTPLNIKEKNELEETKTKLKEFVLKIESGCKIFFLEKKYGYGID